MCAGTQVPLKKKLQEKLGENKVGEMFCLGHCYENHAFHYDGENYAGKDINKITTKMIDRFFLKLQSAFTQSTVGKHLTLVKQIMEFARDDDIIRSLPKYRTELNTGELYMAKSFIKAKGACSAPPPPGSEESKRLLGKMRMKVVGDLVLGKPNLMQLKIRHPNITGMAPLKIGSRVRPPAFFVDSIEINYNGKLIVKASLTFSVSMDPALRFYFVPEKEGTMLVKGTDTKKNAFSDTYKVSLDS